jgi:hypothetical protein
MSDSWPGLRQVRLNCLVFKSANASLGDLLSSARRVTKRGAGGRASGSERRPAPGPMVTMIACGVTPLGGNANGYAAVPSRTTSIASPRTALAIHASMSVEFGTIAARTDLIRSLCLRRGRGLARLTGRGNLRGCIGLTEPERRTTNLQCVHRAVVIRAPEGMIKGDLSVVCYGVRGVLVIPGRKSCDVGDFEFSPETGQGSGVLLHTVLETRVGNDSGRLQIVWSGARWSGVLTGVWLDQRHDEKHIFVGLEAREHVTPID